MNLIEDLRWRCCAARESESYRVPEHGRRGMGAERRGTVTMAIMPAAPDDRTMKMLEDLARKAAALSALSAAEAGPSWGAMHQALLKTKADRTRVARLVMTRDAPGLCRLIDEMCGVGSNEGQASDEAGAEAIPAETLQKALRAFRKRVKLTKLDHESRLGHGPMSSGRDAEFNAMLPPNDFPAAVWEALADRGDLRRAGQGFYMLGEESGS